MIVLDTDMLTIVLRGHPGASGRYDRETEEVVITVATRAESLQGRFATLFKAANAAELQLAQERLDQTEQDLTAFIVLRVDAAVSAEFERLLAVKGLKKIGRGDLLIAAIVLANDARLASRNLKDFRKVPGLRVENWAD